MTAVTPLLWVRECHFEHTSCGTAAEAADVLRTGATVVVPDFTTAEEALALFGALPSEIHRRIHHARRRQAEGIQD